MDTCLQACDLAMCSTILGLQSANPETAPSIKDPNMTIAHIMLLSSTRDNCYWYVIIVEVLILRSTHFERLCM